MDVESTADQIRDDVRLEVGEGQDQIGLQCKDLVDIRRSEGAHSLFLAASLRWTHNVAGDTGNADLFAEQVERFDSLFGEADNSARWEHSGYSTLEKQVPADTLCAVADGDFCVWEPMRI